MRPDDALSPSARFSPPGRRTTVLDLRVIREQTDLVRDSLRRREAEVDLDRILAVDEERRRVQGELDELRRQRNELARSMKGRAPTEEERTQGRALKEREPELESGLKAASEALESHLLELPNLVRPDVPAGSGDEAYIEMRRWGEPRRFDFEPKDHMALGELHSLFDFEAAAKVTGQKFYFLRNEAVLLELALCRYALDRAVAHGFELFQTPDMARRDVCAGTGYSPRGPERQIYTIEDQDLALIGTAEITLGGLHRDEILDADSLPRLYCGVSHCFRTEAGAAGRSGKGLYRVHQFTKVEMFAFTHPDESDALHEKMLEIEEEIFRGLEIPYRVVKLCAGDLGAPSARTYDIEGWMPGREEGGSYGEVTSTSNCTDFQARRLNIRFRDPQTGRPRFVHMLNGTAVAVARTLIPLLENHQQADGTILIPTALRPYVGIERIG
jgi:seryl-tRNA synthetase